MKCFDCGEESGVTSGGWEVIGGKDYCHKCASKFGGARQTGTGKIVMRDTLDKGGGGGLKCKCGEYVYYTGGLGMEFKCEKCKDRERKDIPLSDFKCPGCGDIAYKLLDRFRECEKFIIICSHCGNVTHGASGKIEVIQPLPKKGGGGRVVPGGQGGGGLREGCYVGTGGGKRGTEEMTMDDFIKMAHEINLKLGGKTIARATAHKWGIAESIKLHFTDNTVVEICPEHDEGFRFDYEPTEE